MTDELFAEFKASYPSAKQVGSSIEVSKSDRDKYIASLDLVNPDNAVTVTYYGSAVVATASTVKPKK